MLDLGRGALHGKPDLDVANAAYRRALMVDGETVGPTLAIGGEVPKVRGLAVVVEVVHHHDARARVAVVERALVGRESHSVRVYD